MVFQKIFYPFFKKSKASFERAESFLHSSSLRLSFHLYLVYPIRHRHDREGIEHHIESEDEDVEQSLCNYNEIGESEHRLAEGGLHKQGADRLCAVIEVSDKTDDTRRGEELEGRVMYHKRNAVDRYTAGGIAGEEACTEETVAKELLPSVLPDADSSAVVHSLVDVAGKQSEHFFTEEGKENHDRRDREDRKDYERNSSAPSRRLHDGDNEAEGVDQSTKEQRVTRAGANGGNVNETCENEIQESVALGHSAVEERGYQGDENRAERVTGSPTKVDVTLHDSTILYRIAEGEEMPHLQKYHSREDQSDIGDVIEKRMLVLLPREAEEQEHKQEKEERRLDSTEDEAAKTPGLGEKTVREKCRRQNKKGGKDLYPSEGKSAP